MVEDRINMEPYRQVSLPSGLYRKIEEKVSKSKGDFTSVADFVKYVIRKELEVSA